MLLTVSVHFLDQLVEDLLVERLAHQSEDVGHHIGGDAPALLPVEAVERFAKDCNERIGSIRERISVSKVTGKWET